MISATETSGHKAVRIRIRLLIFVILLSLAAGRAFCGVIPIESGETLSGTISHSGEEVWYSFTANAGDVVNILAVRSASNIEPEIALMAPDGTIVADDSPYSDSAWIGGQVLYQAGIYFIRCRDHYNTRVGSFNLTLIQKPGNLMTLDDPDGGPISSGEFRTGTLGIGDIDAYAFDAKAGDDAVIRFASARYDRSMGFYLQSPSGSIVDNINNSSIVRLSQTGTYYIVVVPNSGLDTGGYSLSLTLIPAYGSPSDAVPIESGETLNGQLHAGACHVYSFYADAGDSIIADITTLDGSSSVSMAIVQPDGNSMSNWWIGDIRKLSQTGVYQILCYCYQTNDTCEYALSFIKIPGKLVSEQDPDGGPIDSGQIIAGRLDRGDIDVYSTQAGAGDILAARITLKSFGTLPNLTVISPSGEMLDSQGPIRYEVLPENGTYYLICQSSESSYASDYLISVVKYSVATGVVEDVDGGRISSGETKAGNITVGDIDMYALQANAGDVLNFSMTTTTENLVSDVALIAPDGEITGVAYGNAINTRLPGTYVVVCCDSDGMRTGNYVLSFLKSPGATGSADDLDGGDIAPAETKSGYLSEGDVDAFTFQANAGDVVTILLETANPALDLAHDVQGPGGIRPTQIQTPGIADAYRISIGGTYCILCNDSAHLQSGNYTISLVKNPGATVSATDSDGGELKSGDRRTGQVVPGDMDVYTFRGRSGQVMELDIQGSGGYPFPFFIVQNPDGTTVASSGDSAQATLAQNGTYYIICMNSSGSMTGSYQLSFDLTDQVAYAKRLPDGNGVDFRLAVISAIFTDCFYVQSENGASGIRVNASATYLTVGRKVNLSGNIGTSENDERCINIHDINLTTFGSVAPVMINNRALGGGDWNCDEAYSVGQRGILGANGLNNIGLLVKIFGRVTHAGEGFFYIDDGSGLEDGSGERGVKIDAQGLSIPSEGEFVMITGISSCYKVEDGSLRRLVRAIAWNTANGETSPK